MKFNLKNVSKKILGTLLILLTSIVLFSCTPPSSSSSENSKQEQPSKYLEAKNGMPEQFVGTWVGDQYGDKYFLEKDKVKSEYMTMNIVSEKTVQTTEGYTLVFCQIPEGQGTEWTPDSYFYAAAFKANGDKLDICSQLDYASVFDSLQKLQEKYTEDYKVESNFFSTCSKQ